MRLYLKSTGRSSNFSVNLMLKDVMLIILLIKTRFQMIRMWQSTTNWGSSLCRLWKIEYRPTSAGTPDCQQGAPVEPTRYSHVFRWFWGNKNQSMLNRDCCKARNDEMSSKSGKFRATASTRTYNALISRLHITATQKHSQGYWNPPASSLCCVGQRD